MFLKFDNSSSTTFDQDRDILLYLYKDIIFKDKNLNEQFEEKDINWAENRPVIKSMVVKTIKSFEENADKEFRLLEISNNWEEDEFFFRQLFVKTIDQDDFLEKAIEGKVENWDIERLALLDKVLLKMAIVEMMQFSSIPVKVTINEYIEISKSYSTPKSRQFINGLLDKIALELTDKGHIRKSGRGLIDNK